MYEKGKKYNIKYANTEGKVCETEITPTADMNTPQLINKLKEDKKDFFKLLENKLIENSQEDKEIQLSNIRLQIAKDMYNKTHKSNNWNSLTSEEQAEFYNKRYNSINKKAQEQYKDSINKKEENKMLKTLSEDEVKELEEVTTKYKYIIGLSKKSVQELANNEEYDAYLYQVIDKENGGIKFGPFKKYALTFNEKVEANEIAGIIKEKCDWTSVVVIPVDNKVTENVKMERKENKKSMDKISQIKKKTESKLQEEYDFFYGNKLQENVEVNSLEEYNKLSKRQKQELIKNYLQK